MIHTRAARRYVPRIRAAPLPCKGLPLQVHITAQCTFSKEHPWDVAKALFRDDREAVETWARARCDDLKQGRLDGLLATLRAHANCEAAGKCADYIDRNRNRMRYTEFRAQGLMVESGVVEAGCKTVVGARLKQSGMRWTVAGANAVIALRCCVLSGRYEDYWAQRAETPEISK